MINNYWDWTYPYFAKGFTHFFDLTNSMSWNSNDLGAAMTYQSSYYWGFFLRTVVGPLAQVISRPELILILLFVLWALFVVLVVSQIFAKDTKINLFLAMAAVFNSAFFYKELAGHIAYFPAFLIFLYGVYYLTKKFHGNFLNYLSLGLILGFSGVQIQFLFFSATLIIVYLLINREKIKIPYLLLTFLIALAINLPWLSNFLIGANTVTQMGNSAISTGFESLKYASPSRIFFMIFSEATNIQYVFDRPVFIYFGLFTSFVLVSLGSYYFYRIIKKVSLNGKENKDKAIERREIDFFTSCLFIFAFLGTGYFNFLPIPFLKLFYPMFRESGHFAPIIILFEVLLLAKTFPYFLDLVTKLFRSRKLKSLLFVCLQAASLILIVGFLLVNIYYSQKYLPKVLYPTVRDSFRQFLAFNEKTEGTYRILAYPFWQQYGFKSQENNTKDGKLLNNSGWDNLMGFSGKNILSNYQPGGRSIEDTLQYKLLVTGDLTELQQKNVKYIYDLQNIYISNWDRYTSPETYLSNKSLVKNDPGFMEKLIEKNPGKISKVQENIYRINDYKPRIYLSETATEDGADGFQDSETQQNGFISKLYFKRINPTKYKIYLSNLENDFALNFLESYHDGWKLYLDKQIGDSSANTTDWCKNPQAQNNNTTECLGKQQFTQWDELKYLHAKPIFDETHEKYDDFGNKWRLDLSKIKENYPDSIKTNNDGTIDLELTLYFWPQTPFYAALVISLTTLFGIICLIVKHSVGKKK